MRISRAEIEELAKDLAIGESRYFAHIDCTTSNKLWVIKSESGIAGYCNKCGSKGYKPVGVRSLDEIFKAPEASTEDSLVTKVVLPEDIETNPKLFHKDALMWLYSSDVRNQDILDYGIGYSPKLHRVIIPVYDENKELVMWQGRGLSDEQTKYYNVRGISKKDVVFYSWVQASEHVCIPNKNKLIVVEDALSVIRVGKHSPTVALLGTSITISNILYLGTYDSVGFWLDDDQGGDDGAVKAMRKLDMLTTCYRIRTDEDPKKLTNKQIEEVMNAR